MRRAARIVLLRHGPTAASAVGAPLGWLDWPTAPEAEAAWPAVRAAVLALRPQLVVTSDLQRCWRHAAELGLPLRIDRRLREQHFGAWDGVPWARLCAPRSPTRRAAMAFLDDPVHGRPPGGESFADLSTRVTPVLATLPRARRVLVLASAGPLRALYAQRHGLALRAALELPWPPFGLALLDAPLWRLRRRAK